MYGTSTKLEQQIHEARVRAEIFAKSLEEAREQEQIALKVLEEEREASLSSQEGKNILIDQLERELQSTVEALECNDHRRVSTPLSYDTVYKPRAEEPVVAEVKPNHV